MQVSQLIDFEKERPIQTMEDIRLLAGYVGEVDPVTVQLIEALDEYKCKETITCSLSSCHHPHNHGWIVKTEFGGITNIGNDCGKTHFGDRLRLLQNEYRARRTLDRQTTILAITRGKAPEILATLP